MMHPDLKKLRKLILETSFRNKAGHIASSFSILEIIYTLYKHQLTEDDKFILSKGHGCLALYAVFLEMGFITEEEFFSFTQYESILGGHPDRNKLKHIISSTGSLGHGLPIAVGLALSKKIKREKGIVYCLIGDGEANEGSVWESLMLASHLQLTNLIPIIDQNNSQIRAVPMNKLDEKLRAFGWETLTCVGNNINDVKFNLKIRDSYGTNKQMALICQTIKGYGVKEMQDNMFEWHHKHPTKEQFEEFCKEIDSL